LVVAAQAGEENEKEKEEEEEDIVRPAACWSGGKNLNTAPCKVDP
jgi:hypothetical protein